MLKTSTMVISTIIIDDDQRGCQELTNHIHRFFPQIEIIGISHSREEYYTLLQDVRVEIVLIAPGMVPSRQIREIRQQEDERAFICLAKTREFAEVAAYWHSVAYLLKPIQQEEFMLAMESAIIQINKVREKVKNQRLLDIILKDRETTDLLGIPTIEGYQILAIKEILRCEGLHKCTRIITTTERSIVSSYNIGEFKRLLSRHKNFFSPHRSHLINMLFVKQFKKSGQIVMHDNASVPIAKSKKEAFLGLITHI